MTARRWSAALALTAGLAALAGCGSTSPAPTPVAATADDDPVPAPEAPAKLAFENKHRERAQRMLQQGRLAEAAIDLELLSLLRPEAAAYREQLAETRRSIDAEVRTRLQRAASAKARSDPESASQQYLAVLALQPSNAVAADALRAIERDRNKRLLLGKYSRLALTRRAAAEAEATPTATPADQRADGSEMEHASLLASQGEIDDAIALLERRLARHQQDRAAALLLADVYMQKGSALALTDKPAAIQALRRSLRLDPRNARAARLMTDLAPRAAVPAPAAAPASGARKGASKAVQSAAP